MTNFPSSPCWNLDDLYSGIDDPQIQSDLEQAQQLSSSFSKQYQGVITKSDAATLAQSLRDYEALEDLIGKLGSYAYLIFAENMDDGEKSRFYQDISEKINAISADLVFYTLELNQISDEKLAQMQTESPELAHYAPWLRDVRVMRPYQLSQDLEALLHEKQPVGAQAWVRLFDETTARMRFPFEGKELTATEIFDHLTSPDEAKRKAAAQSISATYSKHGATFAMITNVLAKDKAIEDDKRGFARPIAARNVANLIEDEVVDALLDTVTANYSNLSERYYKLKAGWMGKDALDYWDRNAPLPEADERLIPWEEAQETVLSAYRAFSPQLAELGQQFFDKGWIDATLRDGKDSGAFSHPVVPSAHPYILMNYQGKMRDVMTLAHELGHGVHQLLAAEQGALMADTPLTLAETASVFGEMLTFRHLVAQEQDDARKRRLIAGKVEDMLNTVVRQVAFCQFEQRVHDARRQGELSQEQLAEIWRETQAASFGKSIVITNEYNPYWMVIPHFIHTPFYVYAYAFGDCLVNALYATYEAGNVEDFEGKYTEMLTAGGTLRHQELLKPFGLNAADPTFWQGGLDVISGLIDSLE